MLDRYGFDHRLGFDPHWRGRLRRFDGKRGWRDFDRDRCRGDDRRALRDRQIVEIEFGLIAVDGDLGLIAGQRIIGHDFARNGTLAIATAAAATATTATAAAAAAILCCVIAAFGREFLIAHLRFIGRRGCGVELTGRQHRCGRQRHDRLDRSRFDRWQCLGFRRFGLSRNRTLLATGLVDVRCFGLLLLRLLLRRWLLRWVLRRPRLPLFLLLRLLLLTWGLRLARLALLRLRRRLTLRRVAPLIVAAFIPTLVALAFALAFWATLIAALIATGTAAALRAFAAIATLLRT
ncbi:MAG: hypothetical protein WAZ48_13905, partial [Lysobacteraceae bacterium]